MKDFFKNRRALIAIVLIVILGGGLNAFASEHIPSISVLVSNIKVFIGSSNYNIQDNNGNDIKVLNDNGVTYAPIRAIGESLGKNVVWDAENNRIILEDTYDVGEAFSFEEYNLTKFPLIAAIPEKNIQLYGIKPKGVVLYNDGVGQPFDWDYMTPRGVLPQIAAQDFDKDGYEDIAVSLYWGSGTGISIEQLHILENAKNNYGDQYYIDHKFLEADYVTQLKEILQYEYNQESNVITFNIQEKAYEFHCEEGFEDLHYSSIVSFQFENNRIKAIFPIGIQYRNSFVFDYSLGTLITEVIFSDGEFTLVEPKWDEN